MKKVITILVTIFPLLLFGQDKQSKLWYENEFTTEALKILTTGIITFIVSYVIFRLEKQKKEKKQISYDLEIKNGLLEIDESIKQNVEISYKNHPSIDLTMVTVSIQNTGDLIIKDQQIRFTFNDSNKVVDTFFEPNVQPELFLTELKSNNTFEKKYNIGHFEKSQSITYRFIVEGDNVDVKLIPFNQEGNVEFNNRSINKEKDEKSTLQNFFIIGFFYFTIPTALSNLTVIGELVSGLLRIIFLMLWYRTFVKSANIFIERLLTKDQKADKSIVLSGSRNIYKIDQMVQQTIK